MPIAAQTTRTTIPKCYRHLMGWLPTNPCIKPVACVMRKEVSVGYCCCTVSFLPANRIMLRLCQRCYQYVGYHRLVSILPATWSATTWRRSANLQPLSTERNGYLLLIRQQFDTACEQNLQLCCGTGPDCLWQQLRKSNGNTIKGLCLRHHGTFHPYHIFTNHGSSLALLADGWTAQFFFHCIILLDHFEFHRPYGRIISDGAWVDFRSPIIFDSQRE